MDHIAYIPSVHHIVAIDGFVTLSLYDLLPM